jgi:hypothetical protein
MNFLCKNSKKGGSPIQTNVDLEKVIIEAVDMADIDTLEEDLLPVAALLCTGCDCKC